MNRTGWKSATSWVVVVIRQNYAAMRNLTSPGPYRLLVVDDHAILREGITELLRNESGLVVCGESDNGPGAVDAVLRLKPDLVILDLSLGEGSGFEVIRQLKSLDAQLLVLVLSMHNEELYAERALGAGAMGYVMKREGARLLVDAIRTVLRGDVFVSPAVGQRLLRKAARHRGDRDSSGIGQLSNRELEVFRLLGEGHTTGEISRQLNLSVSTVETHRANLKRKLGLRNAAELGRAAAVWSTDF